MKILMLAWRDMKHPLKGGAEIVTDIYLNKLVNLGHEVTLFTAKYKDSEDKEQYNNYTIIRKGKNLISHYYGLKYAKSHESEFDIIIDQINTIPFFTPLAIPKNKRIAFFHQLCRNIWFYESKFPISLIGYIAEYFYLKLYKNTRIYTISESSKKDLIKYAWANPNNILVLENQIDFKPVSKTIEKGNYFIYVGRLTKSKRVHDCIKAIKFLENKETKLYIIGDGDNNYKRRLIRLISKLGLDKRVIFTGKISSKERNNIMQKALAILVTSVKEGWGLIVTEANANGTMAITYNTDGLRDANTSNTGIITKDNNPKELASEMNMIINNPQLRKQKEKYALEFARKHSNWGKNVRRLEEWMKG